MSTSSVLRPRSKSDSAQDFVTNLQSAIQKLCQNVIEIRGDGKKPPGENPYQEGGTICQTQSFRQNHRDVVTINLDGRNATMIGRLVNGLFEECGITTRYTGANDQSRTINATIDPQQQKPLLVAIESASEFAGQNRDSLGQLLLLGQAVEKRFYNPPQDIFVRFRIFMGEDERGSRGWDVRVTTTSKQLSQQLIRVGFTPLDGKDEVTSDLSHHFSGQQHKTILLPHDNRLPAMSRVFENPGR